MQILQSLVTVALRGAIIAGALVLVSELFVLALPKSSALQAVAIKVSRRDNGCSFGDVYRAEQVRREHVAFMRSRTIKMIRSDGAYELWRTPLGDFWAPPNNEGQLASMIYEQMHDIYGRPRPDEAVLDVGANVGVYTRRSLMLGASRVIAVEPAPDVLECLRRNFASEIRDGKVVIYPKGAWDAETELQMYEDPGRSGTGSFVMNDLKPTGWKLRLTTIDRIVTELSLDRLDVLKMDIEGAERHALDGAQQTIRRFHPRLSLSVYHLPDDSALLPKIVASADPAYEAKPAQCVAFGPLAVRREVVIFRFLNHH